MAGPAGESSNKRQDQRRQTIQAPGPPLQHLCVRFRLAPFLLPTCILGVGHRKLRKTLLPTRDTSPVQLCKLVEKDTVRPHVGNNVVENGDQNVLMLIDSYQYEAVKRAAEQVKGLAGTLIHQLLDSTRLRLSSHSTAAQIDKRQLECTRRGEYRPGFAIDFRKYCPQRVMTIDQVRETVGKYFAVEGPGEAQSEVDRVEGNTRRKPVERPDPFLTCRQRSW